MDFWRWQATIVMALSVGLLANETRKRFGLLASAVLFYSMISALIVFQSPLSAWAVIRFRLDQSSGQAFAQLACIVFTVPVLLRRKEIAINFFQALAVVESLLLLFFEYGMFGNASIGSTFVAMVLPSVMLRFGKPWFTSDDKSKALSWFLKVFIMLIGVSASRSSTSFLMFLSILATMFALQRSWALLITAVIGSALIGIPIGINRLADSNGRLEAWSELFSWWKDNANPIVGTGIGTLEWIAPWVQKGAHPFVFMHNEYLQILFEAGVIGLILTIALCIQTLRRSIKNPWVLASIVAILVSFLAQFPLRFGVTQVWIAFITAIAITGETNVVTQSVHK